MWGVCWRLFIELNLIYDEDLFSSIYLIFFKKECGYYDRGMEKMSIFLYLMLSQTMIYYNLKAVFRIRIRRIRMFFGLLNPSGSNKQKYEEKPGFLLFCDFFLTLSWKNDENMPSKRN